MWTNFLIYLIGVCLAYICVFSYSVRNFQHIKTKTLVMLSLGSYITIFMLLIYVAAKAVTKDETDFFDIFK
jgi:hypothetical protein